VGRPLGVLLLGDSITEQWRGTAMGHALPSAAAFRSLFAELFTPPGAPPALALAVSGDQTQHLLWRLKLGGEGVRQLSPRTVVLMIGTNNLGAGMPPASVVRGIKAVARAVQDTWPRALVLLCALTPRGEGRHSFRTTIPAVNRELRRFAAKTADPSGASRNRGRVAFIDCSNAFRLAEGGVDMSVMPDALHPNLEGMRRLGRCLLEALARETGKEK
jgi:beta-glucosidase